MPRPRIIVNIFSSIDGRITTAQGRNVYEWTALGLDGGANDITHRLYDELDCDGLIGGSETIQIYGHHWIDMPPVYTPKKSRSFIVFDGSGRINWVQTEGLIVVTRENAPDEYLHQLRAKNIKYITAGSKTHIDIPTALVKLYDLGFRRLGLTGGGTINGVFLQQGLVDEISIVVAPLIVGNPNTPSTFDCPNPVLTQNMTRTRLLNSKPVGNGAFWLHYEVIQ